MDGFITNTADYAPLTEQFITFNANGTDWNDGNGYYAELTFAQALRRKLIESGFFPGIGMLIDTSRNGWGGPNRPTAPSTNPDLNIRVDQSRIDRRPHKDNWCNQLGAGLGDPTYGGGIANDFKPSNAAPRRPRTRPMVPHVLPESADQRLPTPVAA